MGLNKGDGTIYSAIPQSRTQEIINIASISNVDTPGVLIFNISNDVITVDFDEEMSVEYVATNSKYTCTCLHYVLYTSYICDRI